MQKGLSSEEEFESSEKEEFDDGIDDPVGLATLRTPSHVLGGHTSVVIAADWLVGMSKQILACTYFDRMCEDNKTNLKFYFMA